MGWSVIRALYSVTGESKGLGGPSKSLRLSIGGPAPFLLLLGLRVWTWVVVRLYRASSKEGGPRILFRAVVHILSSGRECCCPSFGPDVYLCDAGGGTDAGSVYIYK